MTTVLTDGGTAAAILAGSSGPKIDVATIRLGSGYNYTPVAGDTAFHGSTVYSAAPSNYTIIDSNTVEWVLDLPANVGGFSFGEIGLFTPSNVLLVLTALPTLTQKIASPNNGWNNIKARIRMNVANAPALINWSFYDMSIGRIMELDNYSLLDQPTSETLTSNAFIINYKDDFGNVALALQEDTDTWGISTHIRVFSGAVSAVGTNTISFVGDTDVPLMAYAAGRYLIQYTSGTRKGRVVPVTSLPSANTLGHPALYPAPSVTDTFELLMSNGSYAVAVSSRQGIPVGFIGFFPTGTAPARTRPVDGRALSRVYYSTLFGLLGTTYGPGDGVNTFNIPDVRGEFIRAADLGKNVDAGRTVGSSQSDDFKSHRHFAGLADSTTTTHIYGSTTTGLPGLATYHLSDDSGGAFKQPITSLTGGTETRPRNVALLPIIVVGSGLEVGTPPADGPPLGILTVTPNPATISRETSVSASGIVATYSSPGAATLTLLSGTVPTGLTVTAPNTTDIVVAGTPTVAGSAVLVYQVATSTQVANFTLNITVASIAVNIANKTISDSAIASDVTATYTLNSSGAAQKTTTTGGTTSFPGEWLLAGANTGAEVRATQTSGTAVTGTLGTWQVLSTTRSWSLSTSGTAALTASLLIEIRNAGTLALMDTAVISFLAENIVSGGGGGDGGDTF